MSTSLVELDVEEHCRSQKSRYGQWDQSGKMEAKLMLLDSERLHPVRRLVNLNCSDEPVWAQQILEQLAPQLELVQMFNVQKEHLICLEHMPRLGSVQIEGWSDSLDKEPYIFQPKNPTARGLQFLHLFLPKETAFSFIAAHGNTLKELELYVGLKLRINSRHWVCKDLTKRLSACSLLNLSGLVLRRGDEVAGFHPKERCEAQVKSLKSELPWAHVYCDKCENLPW